MTHTQDRVDVHFGEQAKDLSIDELLLKIEKATKVKEMDKLRPNTVSFLRDPRGRELLEAWQKKYWSLKNCPTCGHTR